MCGKPPVEVQNVNWHQTADHIARGRNCIHFKHSKSWQIVTEHCPARSPPPRPAECREEQGKGRRKGGSSEPDEKRETSPLPGGTSRATAPPEPRRRLCSSDPRSSRTRTSGGPTRSSRCSPASGAPREARSIEPPRLSRCARRGAARRPSSPPTRSRRGTGCPGKQQQPNQTVTR